MKTTTPDNHISKRPRRALYRQRAHCNPLSDAYMNYPEAPEFVDWSLHYPRFFGREGNEEIPLNTAESPADYTLRVDDCRNGKEGPRVEILDCGCGFGGMAFALAEEYPDKLILGLEIREKVSTFVAKKALCLRDEEIAKDASTRKFQNVSVLRTNAMKFLPNYIRKNQLDQIYFCFPDPQFKRANWRRRIVTPQLLSLYAFFLKDQGRLYFVTDVQELYEWMQRSADGHPLFERVPDEEAAKDFGFRSMQEVTEEGKKAIRGGENIYAAMYTCNKTFPHFW